jgi:hypothetical protein
MCISIKKFAENGCMYEFLSEKHLIEKKNRLKRSLGSIVIEVLKYVIFRVFSGDDSVFFLISVASGDEFSKTNCISKFLSQFHPI